MRMEFIYLMAIMVVVGTFLSALVEDDYVGEEEIGDYNTISSYQVVKYNSEGEVNIPGSIGGFFGIVMKLLTWDYAFFEGGFQWIRLFILMPITTMIIIGFIITFSVSVFGFFTPR